MATLLGEDQPKKLFHVPATNKDSTSYKKSTALIPMINLSDIVVQEEARKPRKVSQTIEYH